MVGVAGKYKGCNTCRARRVKCDNTRPFCKKCTDYNRECGGYERETVFIVGTQEDGGRVGSHPPRNASQSRASSRGSAVPSTSGAGKIGTPESWMAAEPLQPAWDETLVLDSRQGSHLVRIAARHADIDSAIRSSSPSSQHSEFSISFLNSQALDVTPTFVEENFILKCFCVLHLPDPRVTTAEEPGEGICLFLYQQNASTMYQNEPVWDSTSVASDTIREQGPAAYQAFPAHHFFARVYRPSAVWAALLNRQPTYLCNPEWTVVPWEKHPRTSFDELLDIVVLLPSIYSRADAIITHNGSNAERRPLARELLDHCASVEAQFGIWYDLMTLSSAVPYWSAEPVEDALNIPFDERLSFASPLQCLVHVYYWTVLVSFHQCVHSLLRIVLNGSDVSSVSHQTLDPIKYQPSETRKLAALVCRSLDFALQTTAQPDLLLAPVRIVTEFYNDMKALGYCELESLWLGDYTQRWEMRSQEMNTWLEEKRWMGVKHIG
ncbi:hypothetical protein F5Y17DRAFT_473183 [Xylariaceae sp. FL0594]|nr:hypothetical protein F5Y17DRAFT_473183 [Xylariaceae sp. FL0594]